MEKNEIVVTGIRPTGKLHLGNYFGAIADLLNLQEKYPCYVFVADLHALTALDQKECKNLSSYIRDVVLGYLAAGLDPKKCTLFVQSSIPEVSELFTLLMNFVMVPRLQRLPAYKDKSKGRSNNNLELLAYPALMAADIFAQKGTIVPLGYDQLPHLEFVRELAGRFNSKFGSTFPRPRTLKGRKDVAKVPGLKGTDAKMSKSDGPMYVIYLTDSPAEVKAKIRGAVTNDLGIRNLFELMDLVSTSATKKRFKAAYKNGVLSNEQMKNKLAADISAFLKPLQSRRAIFEKDYELVEKALMEGAKRARENAANTLKEVKSKMNLFGISQHSIEQDVLVSSSS